MKSTTVSTPVKKKMKLTKKCAFVAILLFVLSGVRVVKGKQIADIAHRSNFAYVNDAKDRQLPTLSAGHVSFTRVIPGR